MLNLDIPPELAQAALEQSEELSFVDSTKVCPRTRATVKNGQSERACTTLVNWSN
jgi:hypothetical protein